MDNSITKFKSFDPLEARSTASTDVAAGALKRGIKNILGSYVGWYDPFCELIQNSLDSIEERIACKEKKYNPSIWITIDIKNNSLMVTDNGIGLGEQEFKQFLAPEFSFKSSGSRGYKGVGATYLAYGFNNIQICTKTEEFVAIGKMLNARKWLFSENPSGNPEIKYDNRGPIDNKFKDIDRGVSIFLRFDTTTHPKDLDWIKIYNADSWFKILSVKTALGSFFPNKKINVDLTVIDKKGKVTNHQHIGIEYFWPHRIVRKSASYKELIKKAQELHNKQGPGYTMPSRFKDIDMFYDIFGYDDLKNMIKIEGELKTCAKKYNPSVYFAYAHSAKVWQAFNDLLKIRAGQKILSGGIQIATDNMPQGEMIQIPLERYIGRQNQVCCIFYFRNCITDVGRKSFKSEIINFAKEVSRKLIDGPLNKARPYLKPNTGIIPDLSRKKEVQDWKEEMVSHEKKKPLELINKNFFLPIEKISITSEPTREQDVIALFNQLVAGGIIRGVRVMSTNERFTYDGLCRVVIEEPTQHHIYHKDKNPLGILKDSVSQLSQDKKIPFESYPMILEYKYSLDGLIEDIETGDKNSNDIELVVVWETGKNYIGNYKIVSLLDSNNLSLRQYHGLTHIMTNIATGQQEMDLIVLSELVNFLKNPKRIQKEQIKKYEDDVT